VADEVDLAQERQEQELALIMANRTKTPERKYTKGVCAYCHAKIAPDLTHCDDECLAAEVYETEQREHQRRINGGTHYARYGN
jgi:hypothetical protein